MTAANQRTAPAGVDRIPRAGSDTSLADRVLAFFLTSPDETLSTDDIAAKFDVSVRGIHTQLADALASKTLRRERDADGCYTYALGPWMPSLATKGDVHETTPGTVKIVKGVPLPGRFSQAQAKWGDLLRRMQVGDSTEPLSRQMGASLRAHIRRVHAQDKDRYTTRRIDAEGRIRVWRIA